ncbi:conserved membrane protein of unknown function [uncultured Sphingopyxis sp.]|uniref:Glycosyltransferase RgtA/B/C/D-like domain-containing protein n=1 Tax=uncultured Sphingopyxis sp. TaxID=310581 RepID=A0A1Y5PWV9_9SPHN|nr:hypothetical protein [uncultured Sphingopyxis sp.]SBV31714.1 conserved membrane protein of unknown function [uncultured Sphingopyxis sp.]
MTGALVGRPFVAGRGEGQVGSGPFAWACFAIGAALLLHLHIALTRAVNWDEFYHYSQIHALARGTLSQPLQTLYTRAFLWVVDLPGTGVDHIILIRLFMLFCVLLAAAAIAGSAARFVDRTAAACCALAYLTAIYVLQHGTSFRFDAPAAALLMTSAWIMLRSRLDAWAILGAAALAGTAAVLTIKTALYAPLFMGIAWLRWSEATGKRQITVRLALTAIVTVAIFAAIFLLHAASLAAGSGGEAISVVSRAGDKMFNLGSISYGRYLLGGALFSLPLTLLILSAPFAIWRAASLSKAEKICLAGYLAPLSSFLFYHNTAPYFYVYILAPAAVACGLSMSWTIRRYGGRLAALVFLLGAGFVLLVEPYNPIDRQRDILRAADRMFARPIAYFDSCALLGRFPKANVFMTPWGTEQYLAGAFPSMEATMAATPVPLVVNDDYMFEAALNGTRPVPQFLPGDLAAIRDTYIPLWGPFWVAGEAIPAGASEHRFRVRVPGDYTVRDAGVVLNGRAVSPGQVVHLDRGFHIASVPGARAARLIWGNGIRPPARPDEDGPLFMPF